jgi:7-cyano-7-deazaguanine reductase
MAFPTSDDLPLGRPVEYSSTYTPSLLRSIERSHQRTPIGIFGALPFRGEDVWTCYELSWLNPKGRPEVAVLKLRVPCNSPCIVESKSLKLYLNSFAQTVFGTRAEVVTTLTSDLTVAVRAPVIVNVLDADQAPEPIAKLPGRSLDRLDVECQVYHWCPDMLEVAGDEVTVRETLHTHLFRSLCPITGQPDWASVMVQYVGRRIPPTALLRYLVSFRNHAVFHETAVEQIFIDLRARCAPEHLTVYARYLRRGGIDINPFRSSDGADSPALRMMRQ